jgi:prepilin-type N-terminal cleavage/methylation domain-containing protein
VIKQEGFTLVEMLLSVAILSLLVGLSLPVYETFVRRNDLDITTQNVVSAFRRAATNARAVSGDSVWGVAVQSSAVTLFKGSSYASRDTGYDEVVSIPGSIGTSGVTEITFAKLTGAPSATGTVTLASTTNDTRAVAVNAEGMVDF